jgi:hypothetical protein
MKNERCTYVKRLSGMPNFLDGVCVEDMPRRRQRMEAGLRGGCSEGRLDDEETLQLVDEDKDKCRRSKHIKRPCSSQFKLVK